MATPRGAEPRDLEQRLRTAEAQIRELTTRLLQRERLEVTAGDFVVSGGGGVDVRDGGHLRVKHPNGQDALFTGDILAESDGSYQGTGLLIEDDTGQDIATFRTDVAGSGQVSLYDKGGRLIVNDDGASSFGLAAPHLDVPLYRADGLGFTTSSGSFVSAYTGSFEVWNPYLDLSLAGYAGNGNEGQLRVQVDGVTQGAQPTFASSQYLTWRVDCTGWALGSRHSLDVDLRRTAGTSTVAVRPYYVRGGQS